MKTVLFPQFSIMSDSTLDIKNRIHVSDSVITDFNHNFIKKEAEYNNIVQCNKCGMEAFVIVKSDQKEYRNTLINKKCI